MCNNNEIILQGTTPSLVITVDPDDFFIDSPSKIELYVQNGGHLVTYTGEDLTIDTEENTVAYSFTEAETAAFNRQFPVFIQARFFFANGAVIGTQRITLAVADMLGVGD